MRNGEYRAWAHAVLKTVGMETSEFDSSTLRTMKKACKKRQPFAQERDRPLTNAELLPHFGYICLDCRMNTVPWSGYTCKQVLKEEKKYKKKNKGT